MVDNPRLAPFKASGERYDSLLVKKGADGEHSEFVIFDGNQAYPECRVDLVC